MEQTKQDGKRIVHSRNATITQATAADGSGSLLGVTFRNVPGVEIVGNGTLQAPLTVNVQPGWVLVQSSPASATQAFSLAVEALQLAKECGGELDHEIYKEAYAAMVDLRARLLAYDAKLNATEQAPTGSDYNNIFDLLGVLP